MGFVSAASAPPPRLLFSVSSLRCSLCYCVALALLLAAELSGTRITAFSLDSATLPVLLRLLQGGGRE